MSTATEQLPLIRAKAAAMKIQETLMPFCSKVGIVGSIRREKKLVSDIELCCTPLLETGQMGLFENEQRRSEGFIKAVAKLGLKLKGNATDGRFVQIYLEDPGTKLDLFIPQEHDFYRQYAIRTGSTDYSSKIIATGWRKLGWVGTEHGLRREQYCSTDGHSWKWEDQDPKQELPPAWQSEKQFFEWLQVPWKRPDYREVWL